MEIIRDERYVKYIAGGPRVYAFCGSRVALIVDDATSDQLPLFDMASSPEHQQAMQLIVHTIERLLAAFDSCVDKVPPVTATYATPTKRGLVRVEVAYIDAAGLAHHGAAGIAFGPAYLKNMLQAALPPRREPLLDHVVCYEMCRNYIFPEEFTRVFDYRLREGPHCWGWVNQGFVNILGCLLTAHLPPTSTLVPHPSAGGAGGGATVAAAAAPAPATPAPATPAQAAACACDFTYYGHTRDGFMRSMEKWVEHYCSDPSLSWESVFLHERLPWSPGTSLDNVYSGILCMLYRAHGGMDFLRGWFRAIPQLLSRAPASKEDHATAADNFVLAACFAAREDISGWFIDFLRWPVSHELSDGGIVDVYVALGREAAAAEAGGSAGR